MDIHCLNDLRYQPVSYAVQDASVLGDKLGHAVEIIDGHEAAGLEHEGSGHTFAIHATDTAVVRKFALRIPVSRFLVNTPAALGGIGATTGLFPALTLGCGAVGGSSSSNNISPLDLINIRRVAWDNGALPAAERKVDNDLVELLTAKILERLK